ncbi:hypothetical protein CYMTET_52238, partial [Cymbomonas tetramitiformis]
SSGFESLEEKPDSYMQTCSKGFYCPNTGSKIISPKGHFCKKLWSEPTKCPARKTCQVEGSTSPDPNFAGVSVLFITTFILTLIKVLITRYLEMANDEFSSAIADSGKTHELRTNLAIELFQGQGLIQLAKRPQGFQVCKNPISIEFRKLTLAVKDKLVLNGVSGLFSHSRLVAIMGPSGCGKSTLMNTLCGKATYGKMGGKVLINQRETPIHVLKGVMGFVPQDDTVFEDLTVLENIHWSARLRLPKTYAAAQVVKLVEGTISKLSLAHIQNSIVGGVEKRGVSGGQKKRVNIGVEMVTDPTVMFLDEPTSGLGATDALLVMGALHGLSTTKRPIIAVIHQPRYQVFELFSDLMLMYPGGYTVYFGPTNEALAYFEKIGFHLPPNENPADFFLDITSGSIPRIGHPKFQPIDLIALWAAIEDTLPEPGGFQVLGPQSGGSVKWESRESVISMISSQCDPVTDEADDGEHAEALSCTQQVQAHSTRLSELIRTGASHIPSEANLQYTISQLSVNPLVRQVVAKSRQRWKQLDADKSGEVSKEEFMQFMETQCSSVNRADLERLFSSIDTEQTCTIKQNEFDDFVHIEVISQMIDEEDDDDDRKQSRQLEESVVTDPAAKEEEGIVAQEAVVPRRSVRHPLRIFWFLLQRASIQKSRSFNTMMGNFITLGVCGLLVGALLSSDFQPYDTEDTKMTLMFTLIMTIVATLSAVNALAVFGDERVMFLREHEAGLNTLAYFTAKCTLNLFENVWQPVFFVACCYNWILPETPFVNFTGILIAVSFSAGSLGILISVTVSRGTMTIVTVLVTLVLSVFVNGTLGVLYADVKEKHAFLQLCWTLSFARWAEEWLLVTELRANQKESYQLLLIESYISYFGFFTLEESDDLRESVSYSSEGQEEWSEYFDGFASRCFLAIMGLGLGFHTVAYFILAYCKQIQELQDYFSECITSTVAYVTELSTRKAKEIGHNATMPMKRTIAIVHAQLSPQHTPQVAEQMPEKAPEKNAPTTRQNINPLFAPHAETQLTTLS